jgi:hypothetical protein
MTRLLCAISALALLGKPAMAADPVKIPFNVVEEAFKTAECTAGLKDEERTDVGDLVGLLKLVEFPCWHATYQSGSILFAVNPAAPERARLLRFQIWSANGLVWTYSLTEPDYDPLTRKLSSFHKGRAGGDCGAIGEWKWVNGDFRLTGYWYKDNCDGKPFDDSKSWRVYPMPR